VENNRRLEQRGMGTDRFKEGSLDVVVRDGFREVLLWLVAVRIVGFGGFGQTGSVDVSRGRATGLTTFPLQPSFDPITVLPEAGCHKCGTPVKH
jgi:hypothetical protein